MERETLKNSIIIIDLTITRLASHGRGVVITKVCISTYIDLGYNILSLKMTDFAVREKDVGYPTAPE